MVEDLDEVLEIIKDAMSEKGKTVRVRDCKEELNKSPQVPKLSSITKDIKGVGVIPNPEIIEAIEDVKMAPIKETIEADNRRQGKLSIIWSSIVSIVSSIFGSLIN